MTNEERFNKIIDDLKEDGIKAAIITRAGKVIISSFNTKGIDLLLAKIYNTAQFLMSENEDNINNLIIKGDNKYVFIYEIGENLLVGVSTKEDDEKIVRGIALMLRG